MTFSSSQTSTVSKSNWSVKSQLMALASLFLILQGCQNSGSQKKEVMQKLHLTVLDPGHFHAALVQKTMYSEIEPEVNVYAPDGNDVEAYLKLINSYNTRTENPTSWKLNVYKGADYLSGFLSQKPGSLVMLAGNNKYKTEYIKKAVDASFHVLSDKPMAINSGGYKVLLNAFDSAEKKHVQLYDIMTSRYDIINILESNLSRIKEIFGELEKGDKDNPAIVKQSTHHFYKTVSGAPLVRPVWFFDTAQQGSGVVDITTHLVDLIQWECFPGQVLNYENDIQVTSARTWATDLTLSQFGMVTKRDSFPAFLANDITNNILNVYSNGEINYSIRGVHAKVSVDWRFQAPAGSSDTYFSMMRGTKANLVVRQDKEQQFKPTLYIEPIDKNSIANYEKDLTTAFRMIEQKHPGVSLKKSNKGWQVVVPDKLKIDHEKQFEKVTSTFLGYVQQNQMPEWEVSFMKTKYYTTTKALEMALKNK